MPVYDPSEIILPTYRLYHFRGGVYKIVKFKRRSAFLFHGQKKTETPKHEEKLDSSISRTKKVVLELALCNNWEYFCTFTLSKDKHDRSDLDKFHSRFTQWLRDQRKKGLDIKFLLVPEKHKDGSWHMHGLFSGIGAELVSFHDLWKQGRKLPRKLVTGDFYNWPAYEEKFGFCSFAFIRSSVAVSFYVLKYITKDLVDSSRSVGLHLYYASRGLNRSDLHAEIYSSSAYLDGFLENDYQFCRTGMTKVKDGLDWTFGLEYVDFEPLTPSHETQETQEIEKYCDKVHDIMQMTFDDYSV